MNRFAVQYRNYSDFIRSLAQSFHAESQNNQIDLPQSAGNGFLKGIDLGNGLSVLIADAYLCKGLMLETPAFTDEFFVLIFQESYPSKESEQYELPAEAIVLKTGVYVRSSLNKTTYFLPAGNHKCVSIIMPLCWLQYCTAATEASMMLANLQSIQPQKHYLQLIDTEYRIIINKLFLPVTEQPLKELFINNRIMLLIEKFFTKHYMRLNGKEKEKHLTTEELDRLITVENKLVNGIFEEAPTIEDLAKMAAMSATKLKRSFKSIFGLPVYEYYQKHRMHVAKDILLSGKYTVKQVGQRVGYQNISHFAAAFKKIHGLLPSQMLVKIGKF